MNGYCSFDLTDLNNPDRPAEPFYIVVSNIDEVAPVGSSEYLSAVSGVGSSGLLPSGGNVTVKLHTSEPVKVTSEGGSTVYTFTKNGEYEFVFKDEAGNVGTAMATVTTIDKEPPRVKIVRSWNYGED